MPGSCFGAQIRNYWTCGCGKVFSGAMNLSLSISGAPSYFFLNWSLVAPASEEGTLRNVHLLLPTHLARCTGSKLIRSPMNISKTYSLDKPMFDKLSSTRSEIPLVPALDDDMGTKSHTTRAASRVESLSTLARSDGPTSTAKHESVQSDALEQVGAPTYRSMRPPTK